MCCLLHWIFRDTISTFRCSKVKNWFFIRLYKKKKEKDWRINYIKYIFISVSVVNGNSHIGLSILNFENQFLPVDVKQKCMKWICGETPHKSKGKRVEKMIFDLEKVSYFLWNWEERVKYDWNALFLHISKFSERMLHTVLLCYT